MARLALNKSKLTREVANLAMYQRFLPALDLKRQQLMAERKKAEARLAEIKKNVPAQIASIGAEIPMLANQDIDLKSHAYEAMRPWAARQSPEARSWL